MTQIVRGINSYTASVGDVLRKNAIYIVPEYQRDYSWTQDEVEELWEDITGAVTRPNDDYFMGAIVVSPSSKSKRDTWDIVDGQQRLTTLSMIFSAIQRQWKIMEDDRHLEIRREYLGDRDRETRDFTPKIRLNGNNNDMYIDIVINHEICVGNKFKQASKSNRHIVKAFESINSNLENWLSDKNNKVNALIEIERFVSDRLKLIIIEAVSDYDAYLIFETLNDRGLDLAVSDLVKNHLFRYGGGQIDDFKRKWLEINNLVGEDIKTFLRHFWISENQLINERDLYKKIREKVNNNTSAKGFINRMRKAAFYYSALSNHDSEVWEDYPDTVREDLYALNLFRVSQFRPIVLAAIEKFSPVEVAKTIRLLLIISIRYSVISKLSTGSLEKTYGWAVHGINSGRIKNSRELFAEVKNLYVDDIRFKDNMVSIKFDKPAITRYILAKICETISNDQERSIIHNGKITLEHIMPQSQEKNWDIENSEARENLHLLGNLTLLEKSKNQSISNKSFIDKLPVFEMSALPINHIISNKTQWTSEEIKERGDYLADIAIQTWKFEP